MLAMSATVRAMSGITPFRKNVSHWRAYNRRRWEFEEDAVSAHERVPFVCECTRGECFTAVERTMHEFESAHTCPNWLLVAPGHVMPGRRCEKPPSSPPPLPGRRISHAVNGKDSS